MAREIYAYKCRLCGTLHYPFRMVCKGCKQNDFFEFDTVPLPKTGKLLTFTRVYNLPAQYEVATLGLGIVELDNGMRMLGQLEIDEPEIGMAVKGSGGTQGNLRRLLRDGVHGSMMGRHSTTVAGRDGTPGSARPGTTLTTNLVAARAGDQNRVTDPTGKRSHSIRSGFHFTWERKGKCN